jgi:hypothetical protein
MPRRSHISRTIAGYESGTRYPPAPLYSSVMKPATFSTPAARMTRSVCSTTLRTSSSVSQSIGAGAAWNSACGVGTVRNSSVSRSWKTLRRYGRVVAAAAPVVQPWYAASIVTITGRFFTSRAVRSASSTDSEPVLTNFAAPCPVRAIHRVLAEEFRGQPLALVSQDLAHVVEPVDGLVQRLAQARMSVAHANAHVLAVEVEELGAVRELEPRAFGAARRSVAGAPPRIPRTESRTAARVRRLRSRRFEKEATSLAATGPLSDPRVTGREHPGPSRADWLLPTAVHAHHPAPSSIAIGWPAGTTTSVCIPPKRPR